MNFFVVIILWFVPSISMAQIPPPPAAPSFRTEWLSEPYPRVTRRWDIPRYAASLQVGEDVARSRSLVMKIVGTAIVPSYSIINIVDDLWLIKSNKMNDGIVKISLDKDDSTGEPIDLYPGTIIHVFPYTVYSNGWLEYILPNGDTFHLEYFYHFDNMIVNFQRLQRPGFKPSGLTISNRVAGTRERTGPGWGRPARKPVVEDMTWGRIKNRR